jgi:hypothetical protein
MKEGALFTDLLSLLVEMYSFPDQMLAFPPLGSSHSSSDPKPNDPHHTSVYGRLDYRSQALLMLRLRLSASRLLDTSALRSPQITSRVTRWT